MNKTTEQIRQGHVELMKAIEDNPVEAYREHRGPEADALAKLPGYMQPGMVRYILLGIKPGSFLCAIFAGEFDLAKLRADQTNLPAMEAYQDFLRWACPGDCWGSGDRVREWCEGGGLIGRLELSEI